MSQSVVTLWSYPRLTTLSADFLDTTAYPFVYPTHTPSLSFPARAHLGSRCPPSFHAIAPWHGAAAAEGFSLPFPSDLAEPPKGNDPAPCVPRQPPGFGFFSFMTQLAGLNPPNNWRQFPRWEDGKRGRQSEFIDRSFYHSIFYSLGSGF